MPMEGQCVNGETFKPLEPYRFAYDDPVVVLGYAIDVAGACRDAGVKPPTTGYA